MEETKDPGLFDDEGEGEQGTPTDGKVISLPLVSEIKESYLNYAMSVIIGRALPDARDGLKPVQRRILYAMDGLGLRHSSSYKKSATVVGDTMGKYHPHGDSAIYDTMVRMAQPWSLRYPLVDGQGNFGSVDGDSAAAMRYTEARLFELGELMLADIDEDSIDWTPNFDESLKEPIALPSAIPNLLVNGGSGIAVGMATNIPPHNLREVVDALCLIIDARGEPVSLDEVMALLPGPDFPTGGVILGRGGIRDAYATGRGRVLVRGRTHVEEGKRGRVSVIITEIPFMLNKTTLIESMVTAVQEKNVDGVSDIRDESDRDGMRIVVELSRDGDPELVIRQLFKRTPLQSTFGVINLAIDRGRPRELPIIEMLSLFLNHRREVVRRRTQFRLEKARARAHIVEGLSKALGDIERVIAIIRAAKTAAEARDGLIERLGFSDVQANAIMEMRLQRLTGLERDKLAEELRQLRIDMAEYEKILGDAAELDGVIRGELSELAAKFGDDRRTEILDRYEESTDEELIQESDIAVILSKDGYLKRQALESYSVQSRGGKGRKGAFVQEEDAIKSISVTHTHRPVYFFSNRGRVLAIKGHMLPEMKTGKGKHISKILPLEPGESIVTVHGGENTDGVGYVFFITKLGTAKRIELSDLASSDRPRRVITLDEGDEIAEVRLTRGSDDLLLMTAGAQALRVSEDEFRAMGRSARGVRAMRLDEGDFIISCDVIAEAPSDAASDGESPAGNLPPVDESYIFILSEHGIGKRSRFSEFTRHHRGGSGVKAMNLGPKTGRLVGCWSVSERDELMAVTARGRVIRVALKETPLLSRVAMGNITVKLDEGDQVADCSIIRVDADQSSAQPQPGASEEQPN
ncbi:MAG: DNA gyrase subunit A [Synergistaceae bacterium]|jgi:DNA gyrase subunit A|nr:DNA gyrase subunit A [Synergistaceae bacterium]